MHENNIAQYVQVLEIWLSFQVPFLISVIFETDRKLAKGTSLFINLEFIYILFIEIWPDQ